MKDKEQIDILESMAWRNLVDSAQEYIKYMHPHKTVIITQSGIELLEGEKACPLDIPD